MYTHDIKIATKTTSGPWTSLQENMFKYYLDHMPMSTLAIIMKLTSHTPTCIFFHKPFLGVWKSSGHAIALCISNFCWEKRYRDADRLGTIMADLIFPPMEMTGLYKYNTQSFYQKPNNKH